MGRKNQKSSNSTAQRKGFEAGSVSWAFWRKKKHRNGGTFMAEEGAPPKQLYNGAPAALVFADVWLAHGSHA
jgi:hypothetical protein